MTVIDYGIGNLLSVCRAIEHCGAEARLTSDASEVASAERLVLPGVGAFKDGMKGLTDLGLDQAIKEFAAKDRPFLGICLGMQMMLDTSEEFPEPDGRLHQGLGLIPGAVIPIPLVGTDGTSHKVPNVGWHELVRPEGRDWAGTILNGVPEKSAVYFVHSFTPAPVEEVHRLADIYYNGVRLSAVINRGMLYGCQFHPEKSGETGLQIIKNFLSL